MLIASRSRALVGRTPLPCARARLLATSAFQSKPAAQGFFQRPAGQINPPDNALAPSKTSRQIAQPHTPSNVPAAQAPNVPTTWSPDQQPRTDAMKGPRFEQMNMDYQPQPLAAIEMVAREPIRLSGKRVAACDGGGGPLGHPRVFINLDKPGPKPCPYCGLRYELDHSHAHGH